MAFGLFRAGDLIYSGATGVKDVSTRTPYKVKDVQCLLSISKSVTAAAIMQHAAEQPRRGLQLQRRGL
jgi:CubicO group peptidase (beta-lactamase class C family)